MTQNAGRGRQSVSPLKQAVLEVFRRRNLSKDNSLGKRPISAGKHCIVKEDFTETDEETMPSRLNDGHGQSRKAITEHHRKKRRSRSKPRHREQPKPKHRETAAVTELMRKAKNLEKMECKVAA
jgi:hypothetical protein